LSLTGTRKLGKGGKGGKGGNGAGWTSDGSYYGCLSLSGQEMYDVSYQQNAPNCDYVVHTESGGYTDVSDANQQ
jgi:hypothetical protein